MFKRIIGINICKTRAGIQLNDGACALFQNGKPVVAIAEERLSRKKYDGNFIRSLNYCLAAAECKIADIDSFVFSNCCDEPLDEKYLQKILEENNITIPKEKILISKSHHLSHAYSAYFASSFNEALIMVADNEGNVLQKKSEHYWLDSLERTSFYYAKGNKIRLIERYHAGFKELGLAANYNYFTQCIGYKSYQEAGKTMALASYGEGELINSVELYNKENNKSFLKSQLYLFEQIDAVRNFVYERSGKDVYKNKTSTRRPSQMQKELATLIQVKTEEEVIRLINKILKRVKTKNLCIAGGLGLNCVANFKIAKETGINNIFIQPAAGDTGQCIGNGFYGTYASKDKDEKVSYDYDTYLGRKYSRREINDAIKQYRSKIDVRSDRNLIKKVASLLKDGKVVSIFQGGSEFGPRALGNRSILIDPRNLKAKKQLNRIKTREYYRPYAPIVMEEFMSDYFEFNSKSPFMLLAVPVVRSKRKEVPAIVHKDGTTRVQSLNKSQNKKMYNIINEFRKLTGTPLLLNTSFNRAGEPLVESPKDALECFLGSEIDYMLMGNNLLEKNEQICNSQSPCRN